jgi:hypothetical protein
MHGYRSDADAERVPERGTNSLQPDLARQVYKCPCALMGLMSLCLLTGSSSGAYAYPLFRRFPGTPAYPVSWFVRFGRLGDALEDSRAAIGEQAPSGLAPVTGALRYVEL